LKAAPCNGAAFSLPPRENLPKNAAGQNAFDQIPALHRDLGVSSPQFHVPERDNEKKTGRW
jgi:hypothetical protein